MASFGIKNCEVCGAEFLRTGSRHRYCSKKCQNIGQSTIVESKKERHICKRCGSQFHDRHNKNRIYCSAICRDIDRPTANKRFIDQAGYVVFKLNRKRTLEHRYIMEQKLGRKLLPWPQESVHHIDGNKSNNHPDNLELRQGNHGINRRVGDNPWIPPLQAMLPGTCVYDDLT
jgi:endogenous inhibitor of DNA gyrase (YacG/DUF329 family)